MMSGAVPAILQPEAPSMRMNRRHAELEQDVCRSMGSCWHHTADEIRPPTTQIPHEGNNPDWLKPRLTGFSSMR